MSKLETVLAAYIACALWLSTEFSDDTHPGEPLDRNYDADDIAPESHARMRDDCAAFIEQAGDLLAGWDDEQIGHDFWLTRNHHGAGFWDRGRGAIGDALTKIADGFGSCDLYIGDDGRLHV